MGQVYDVVPYLQNKLERKYNRQKCLCHPDVVALSSQLDCFILQEQKRKSRVLY